MLDIPQEIIDKHINVKPTYERVYRILKEGLCCKETIISKKITEKSVCEALNVSRTPVRTALERLNNEGILQNISKSNVGIKQLNNKELDDLLFLCETLECKAAYLAAINATEEDISLLKDLNNQICTYHHKEHKEINYDMYGVRDLHMQFHLLIAKCSKNDFLYKYIIQVRSLMRIYKSNKSVPENAYPKDIYPLHSNLIHAIENRDSELAEMCMKVEIRFAKERYMNSKLDINIFELYKNKDIEF